RDRLQDNPGVLRELPQRRIELPPHCVGAMVPRGVQIQSQLREGIEPVNLRGQKAVYRVADTCVNAHGFLLNPRVSSTSSALATEVMSILATRMCPCARASASLGPTRPGCGSMNTV